MGRRRLRDLWLAVLLMAALAVVVYMAAAREADEATLPPLAAQSTQPDGAQALTLWMKELGYTVDAAPKAAFTLRNAPAVLMVIEPIMPVAPDVWEELDAWLHDGGTLIVAGQTLWTQAWADHFGITMRISPVAPPSSTVKIQTPLWQAPPQTTFPEQTKAATGLRVERGDVVVHATSEGAPVVLTLEVGEGRVVLSTATYPFTNAGLQEPGNPEFVLNLLAFAGEPGAVWYDDWHHGIRATAAAGGFGSWLRTSTAGRGLLLAALVIFVALVLRGRVFGRPVTPAEERTRRTPMEYVTAMANLQRRAHHRHAVLMDYHMRLKRTYARRYHIAATLPDDEFAARVARADPTVAGDELGRLLVKLTNPRVSEEEMIRLAATAVAWTENRASHRKGTPHAD